MSQQHSTRRAFVHRVAGLAIGASAASRLLSRSALAAGVPIRKHPELIVRSPDPLDLETPAHLLDSWITPNDLFYVRSHLFTPKIDAAQWRLTVEAPDGRRISMSLDDLKRLPRVEQVVTMECAGNGRALFRPRMAGAQWLRGAVGTARWAGVRLADLLEKAGAPRTGFHVAFDAADQPIGNVPDFLRSVPVEKCFHPATMLAYEMNGEPLPVQHGYPLRAIVPGWEGAACVKWLTRLVVQQREAEGFFMNTAYRYPTRPVAPGEAVSRDEMRVLTSVTIKSLVTHPRRGARFQPGATVEIRGNAWAGEAEVARVQISTDLGRTWADAELGRERAPFAWRRFRFRWKAPERGSYVLMSRATDNQSQIQPVIPQWNPSGYLFNAPDQVRVAVGEGVPAPSDDAEGTPPALPAGAAREITEKACLGCHDATLITQQRLSRARWEAEMDKMVRWGASVSDQDKKWIVDYLFAHFPE